MNKARPTVLVIDDRRELCEKLTAHLTVDGLGVAVAANGHDARLYLRAGLHVCAMVVNLTAPPGWAFLAQRHGDGEWRKREVFVISGVSDEDIKLLVSAIRAHRSTDSPPAA